MYKAGEYIRDTEGNPFKIMGVKENGNYDAMPVSEDELPMAPKPTGYFEAIGTRAGSAVARGVKQIPDLVEAAGEAVWEFTGEVSTDRRKDASDILDDIAEDTDKPTLQKTAQAGILGDLKYVRDVAKSAATSVASSVSSLTPDILSTRASILSIAYSNTPEYIRTRVDKLREKGVDISEDMELSYYNAIKEKDVMLLDANAPDELKQITSNLVDNKKKRDMYASEARDYGNMSKKIESTIFEATGAEQTGSKRVLGDIATVIGVAGATRKGIAKSLEPDPAFVAGGVRSDIYREVDTGKVFALRQASDKVPFVALEDLPEGLKMSFGKELGLYATTESLFASGPGVLGEEEDNPALRRLLPLSGIVGGYGVKGAGKGAGELYDVLFTKEGRPVNKSWDVESVPIQKGVVEPYLKKIFKIDEETGEVLRKNSPTGLYNRWRTSNIQAFNDLENMARAYSDANRLNYGSRDTLALSPHQIAVRSRENRKSLAYGFIEGDGNNSGGYTIDPKTGLTQDVGGVTSYRGIYKEAISNGANPEDLKNFQIARDAVDNYKNLHEDMATSLRNAGELTEDIGIPSSAWTPLIKTLYGDNNSLVNIPWKQGDRLQKVRDKAVQQAEAITEGIKNPTLRTAVEEELTRAIDSASRRSTIDFPEAQKMLDQYLTATPWASDVGNKLTKLHDHILDQYVKSGIVNPADAAEWKARHPGYLPNYKVTKVLGFDDEGMPATGVPKTLRSLSERKVSPLENIDPVTAEINYMVTAGYRIAEAHTRKSIIDSVMEFTSRDEFNKYISYADKSKLESVMESIANGTGKKHYTIDDVLQDDLLDKNIRNVVQGVPVHINGSTIEIPFRAKWVQDLMRDSRTKDLDTSKLQMGAGKAAEVWHNTTRVTRDIIVMNPIFGLRTMVQEMQDHVFWSDVAMKKRLGIVKALPDLFVMGASDKELYKQFKHLNAGIYHGNMYDTTQLNHKQVAEKFIKDTVGNKGVGDIALGKLSDGLNEILQRTDNAPRMRYYKMLKDSGYSDEAAMTLAKTQGVNFTQRGANPNSLVDRADYWMPFARVGFNSADRAARRFVFESRKSFTSLGTMGFTYWLAEKAGILPTDEERGIATYSADKGIPLIQDWLEDSTVVLPAPFIADYKLSSDIIGAIVSSSNEMSKGIIEEGITNIFDKKTASRVVNNPATLKELTGGISQYILDNLIALPRAEMGLTGYLATQVTGVTPQGIPYPSPAIADKIPSQRFDANTSPTLVALSQKISDMTDGEVQIPPQAVHDFAIVMRGTLAEMSLDIVDYAGASAGFLPEKPEKNVLKSFASNFIVPKEQTLAKQRFHNMYSNLLADTSLADKEMERLKGELKAGKAVDPDNIQQVTDWYNNTQTQREALAILQGYNRDFAALRDEAVDLIWDRDSSAAIPPGEEITSLNYRGNKEKRRVLRDIRDRQAELAGQAIKEIASLPDGEYLLESYALPFKGVSKILSDMIPISREAGATYNDTIDDFTMDEEETFIQYKPMSNTFSINPNTQVIDTIKYTAEENGINPNTALMIAAMESDFKPDAKATTSSATGVFQITKPTWKSMIDKGYGQEYGIDRSSSVDDPVNNIRMGILLMKENNTRASMELGRQVNFVEQYALHHFGYDAGVEFIRSKDDAPYTPITSVLSRSAYNANPQLKRGNRPMTVAEVANMWVDRANKKYTQLTTLEEDMSNDD